VITSADGAEGKGAPVGSLYRAARISEIGVSRPGKWLGLLELMEGVWDYDASMERFFFSVVAIRQESE